MPRAEAKPVTVLVFFASLFCAIVNVAASVEYVVSDELVQIAARSCVLLLFDGARLPPPHGHAANLSALLERYDIPVYLADIEQFRAPHSDVRLHVDQDHKRVKSTLLPTGPMLVVVHRHRPDRACLLKSAITTHYLTASLSTEPSSVSSIIELLNAKCHLYATRSGELSPAGLRRAQILADRYSVGQHKADSLTFAQYQDGIDQQRPEKSDHLLRNFLKMAASLL